MPGDVAREMSIALPGDTDDIYLRHQQVWKVMAAYARVGTEFLYTLTSPHLALVRSSTLPRGIESAPVAGRLRLDVVAARRDGNRLLPLESHLVPDWVAERLAGQGFAAEAVSLVRRYTARGRKRDATSGQAMEIALPIAEVRLSVRIENGARARLAWSRGIGRGLRFGFGMLRPD